MIRFAGVTSEDVDTDALLAAVSDDRAGAVVSFAGVVRNHDHGKAVTGIEYVGHPSADQVMRDVVAQFAQRDGVHAVAAQHRVGHLGIGEWRCSWPWPPPTGHRPSHAPRTWWTA